MAIGTSIPGATVSSADDPSSMVRRSVANHLNDLSKSDPDRVAALARRWLRGASPERRALVEHALRSSVKSGHAGSLEVLGFGGKPLVVVSKARFSPARVAIGGKVRIDFDIAAARGAGASQALVVDLVVHFVKARGTSSPKVFKIARLDLATKEQAVLGKTISLAVHTTRKPNPGRHAVDALVNGVRFELGAFHVKVRRAAGSRTSRSRETRAILSRESRRRTRRVRETAKSHL